ncbi:hypothetical protein PG990_002981 [Apiospora arundinis]
MHGRQKGPSQRAQITIHSSSPSVVGVGGGGGGGDGKSNNKKTGGIFVHALERLRRKDHSFPLRLEMASEISTTTNRVSEKGDMESARVQEGKIPRGQWIENGIMKTVSVRVNSGENFDVEHWDLGTRER